MSLMLGALAAVTPVESTQQTQITSVAELPYIDAVRHAVVEDCIGALMGIWSLNDNKALNDRGLEKAPEAEESKRAKPFRVAPDMAERRFDNANIGIRLDPGMSCMVTFDGPQHIEARDKLFDYLDMRSSGFKKEKARKSKSGFTGERSYSWRMSNGVNLRYDIGTREEGRVSGIVSAIIWMPWIK